jgi:decaprenylphospho-beta-D-ribofuranose 2-oxidase
MPLDLPSFVLGRATVAAFNEAFYWKHLPREMSGIVALGDLLLSARRDPRVEPHVRQARLHAVPVRAPRLGRPGRRAPRARDPHRVAAARRSSASSRTAGPEGEGLLSFPMEGISIALDIPVRDDTQALVDALNEQGAREGGRIYLTKDQFTRPEHFQAMEPRLAAFPGDPPPLGSRSLRIRSAQSVRLFGDRV